MGILASIDNTGGKCGCIGRRGIPPWKDHKAGGVMEVTHDKFSHVIEPQACIISQAGCMP